MNRTTRAFVAELELAIDHPPTRELQPLDAMTPHIRDVRTSAR